MSPVLRSPYASVFDYPSLSSSPRYHTPAATAHADKFLIDGHYFPHIEVLVTLRAVCRRFRTLADRRLAKQILLVEAVGDDPYELEGPFVFALRPPRPDYGATRGPLLGSLNQLQSGFLYRALEGGTVDLTQFGTCPEIRSSIGMIRLRSSAAFDPASLAICSIETKTVVQFLRVTPANDPFIDIPLLPREVDKLVFHISYDSSRYLTNTARSVPFESYRRREVVFILHDEAEPRDLVTERPPQLLCPGQSLLTSLATGIQWYALTGAQVTVVGLDALNPGWLGVNLKRSGGRISTHAIRTWLKRAYPIEHERSASAWSKVTFVTLENYRAQLGDEQYALETVE